MPLVNLSDEEIREAIAAYVMAKYRIVATNVQITQVTLPAIRASVTGRQIDVDLGDAPG